MPLRAFLASVIAFAVLAIPARPYSVQTHQQIIDLVWLQSIQPLLLSQYPGLTPKQLQEAHAYAYGGSAIQDLGYYPFGNAFFSNLTHYVRSGDFVLALIRDARNANELAFAVGALSHYLGDTYGHSECVNPSVATVFPSLAKKYGPMVTYEENEHAHVRTEFAFDINEISKRHFAPLAYLRHVGLEIPTRLLNRAFFETYGLDAVSVVGHRRPVLRSYRFAVRSFLPRIAYAESILHRHSFPPDDPNPQYSTLAADLAQASIDNHWEEYRHRPGIGTYSLAGLIFLLPKVGPLNLLAIRGPVPSTEELYVASVNDTVTKLRGHLQDFDALSHDVPNRDLDTGLDVRPGSYRLTDQTYATLLRDVTADPTRPVPPILKHDLIAYYADPNAPISTRRNKNQWAQVQANLATLASVPTTH
ncbi:zinc dependent phospholipase C family protein [Granulicella sibirica]|uniref:Phospholipase C/D domain-containing protein n=1 Tax=Granulicella sibirica TaxID=2479048 RepID=A0A4Q0SXW4_9BACT|nr:zinc dependent phospholipase C family protein [Granulicella sibirica]RXH55242.1 hypothetical protein GRAN_4346 [Granulicella sibirica]